MFFLMIIIDLRVNLDYKDKKKHILLKALNQIAYFLWTDMHKIHGLVS